MAAGLRPAFAVGPSADQHRRPALYAAAASAPGRLMVPPTQRESSLANSVDLRTTTGGSGSTRRGGRRLPRWMAAFLLIAYCSVFWVGLGTLAHWVVQSRGLMP